MGDVSAGKAFHARDGWLFQRLPTEKDLLKLDD